MFFITYSQQILFLTLAVGAAVVAVFLACLLFYLISAARQLRHAVAIVRGQAEAISAIINKARLALAVPSAIVGLIIEAIKKFSKIQEKGGKKTKKSSGKK